LKRNNAYCNLYYISENNKIIILVLYVDELLFIGSNKEIITWLKLQLENMFEMIKLGNLRFYLVVEFIKLNKGIFMTLKDYVTRILENF
jgi:hypothetical protein